MRLIKILIISIFICLAGLFMPQVQAASYNFSPSSGDFQYDCDLHANLYVNTEGKVSNAADIEINYDTARIQISDANSEIPGVQVIPGNAYEAYVYNQVDTSAGIIRIAAVSFAGKLNGNKLFLSIPFRPINNSNGISFTVNFTGMGNTLDSNIAEDITNDDLLSSVTNGSFTFSPGSCVSPQDLIPPVITNLSLMPEIRTNNGIHISITDEGSGVDISTLIFVINGQYFDRNTLDITYTGDKYAYDVNVKFPPGTINSDIFTIIIIVNDFSGNTGYRIVSNSPEVPTISPGISQVPSVTPMPCVYECPATKEIKDRADAVASIFFTLPALLLILLHLGSLVLLILSLLPYLTVSQLLSMLFSSVSKKKNYTGVVFDIYSYSPVAFAKIEVFSENGSRVFKTATDDKGGYKLDLKGGIYTIKLHHNNYKYNPALVTAEFEKENYWNKSIYKGQKVEIQRDGSLQLDIPMERTEEEKVSAGYLRKLIIYIYAKLSRIFMNLYVLTFLLIVNVILYWLLSNVIYLVLLVYYVLLIVIVIYGHVHNKLNNCKLHGYVYQMQNGNMAGYSIVKIYNSAGSMNTQSAVEITDALGHYEFQLAKGKFDAVSYGPGHVSGTKRNIDLRNEVFTNIGLS